MEEALWFKGIQAKAAALAPTLKRPVFDKIDSRDWDLELGARDQTDPELAIPPEFAHQQLLQVGSLTRSRNLREDLRAQGVIVCDWAEALEKHGDLLQKYFGQAVPIDENRLTAEHAASINNGILVYVPKNVAVKEPITVAYLQDATRKQDFVEHVLLIADVNSSVSYMENLATIGGQANTASIVVEVIARAGSQVKYAGIDRLGQKTTAYIKRVAKISQDAKVDWALGMLSDGKILGDFDSNLIGTGSKADMNIIAITIGDQIQGLNTVVNNYGRKSVGHILQHGVILQRSSLIFDGIGHVMKGAKGADAQQENRVLMLSRAARGDANPILLIDDNDVFAGHAASVGRVDEQQLYYLMSRGIPKKTAERLVIRGFLGPVLTRVPSADVRQRLFAMVERKLIDGQDME